MKWIGSLFIILSATGASAAEMTVCTAAASPQPARPGYHLVLVNDQNPEGPRVRATVSLFNRHLKPDGTQTIGRVIAEYEGLVPYPPKADDAAITIADRSTFNGDFTLRQSFDGAAPTARLSATLLKRTAQETKVADIPMTCETLPAEHQYVPITDGDGQTDLPPAGKSFVCTDPTIVGATDFKIQNGVRIMAMDDAIISFSAPGAVGTATQAPETPAGARRISFTQLKLMTKNDKVYKNLTDVRVTLSRDYQSVIQVEMADSGIYTHSFTNCELQN